MVTFKAQKKLFYIKRHFTRLSVLILLSFPALVHYGCARGTNSETGLPEAVISELATEIEHLVAEGISPSVQVAVISEEEIAWSHTFGQVADSQQVYIIGSVQKVFDATAILQLYEKGLVDLDADINTYLPFSVRHPDYPATPITLRMIVSHRSGLSVFKHQFAWDTKCLGYPEYRSDCAEDLIGLSLGEFLKESVTFDGRNYSPDIWRAEPDKEYHYSVAGYHLLKYVIARVSGQSYADYMRNNLFAPLHMDNAGFYVAGFEGQHALPHTYVDGEVIELPLWEGNGDFMRMTATDLAKFQLAHLYDGSSRGFQMIKPETVELMRTITTRRYSIFNRTSTLYDADCGLGIRRYAHGWMGLGGSVPGYLCIWRYNPDRHVGYAFLMNVNSILMGGDNSGPVTESYLTLKNTIENRLAPTILFRGKIMFIGGLVIIIFAVTVLIRKRLQSGHNRV